MKPSICTGLFNDRVECNGVLSPDAQHSSDKNFEDQSSSS